MNIDYLSSRWAPIAEEYDQFRLSPPLELVKTIKRFTQKDSIGLIIDLGCGTGLSTRPWSKVANKVVGIDPLPEMLSIAKSKMKDKEVEFLQGYSHSTALRENSVDIVVCNHSIHWMEPESTISEITRILKHDGIFVIMGHNFPPVSEHLNVDKEYFLFRNKCDQLTASLNLNEGFH